MGGFTIFTSLRAMEKFCLKWNDFQTTVSQSFGILRQEEDFFDVTLVSDDEVQVSAHKLVLSACSTFFKTILKKNVHSNPLIYLSGVSSTYLSFVLDYIYHGEVEIFQEHLDGFLDVAQKLKVSGLISNQNAQPKMEEKEEDDNEMKFQNTNDTEKIYDERNKSENKSQLITYNLESSDKSEINMKINELLTKSDGLFRCRSCGKSSKDKTNMKRHIETHIDGLSYSCQMCDKTFRTSQAFHTHTGREHNNKQKY